MKVLVITYYFSPSTVIGAKRWTDFYNLSQQDEDVELTILTSNASGKKVLKKNVHYLGDEYTSQGGNSLQKEIGFFDLFRHPSLFIRSFDRSVFLPWIKECKQWMNLNYQNQYDLILASYGPTAPVILGTYAKEIFNVPYVLDLRDLISIQGQKIRLPFIHELDQLYDKFLTRKVDEFLTVSPKCNSKATSFYRKKASLVYNGFEKELNFKNTNLSLKDEKEYKILYAGTLGNSRNPKKIIRILNNFAKKNPLKKISVSFASRDNPLDFIEEKDYSDIQINCLGFLPKDQLSIEKKRNNIFLLLEDQTPKGDENLTGKIYEYFEEEKPILVSCSITSDIVKVIKKTNTGAVVSSVEELELFFQQGRIRENEACKSYSRVHQYYELKKSLNLLLSKLN